MNTVFHNQRCLILILISEITHQDVKCIVLQKRKENWPWKWALEQLCALSEVSKVDVFKLLVISNRRSKTQRHSTYSDINREKSENPNTEVQAHWSLSMIWTLNNPFARALYSLCVRKEELLPSSGGIPIRRGSYVQLHSRKPSAFSHRISHWETPGCQGGTWQTQTNTDDQIKPIISVREWPISSSATTPVVVQQLDDKAAVVLVLQVVSIMIHHALQQGHSCRQSRAV